MKNTVGVYIHIPFCASKCGYCDFYSLASAESLIKPYLDALGAHFRETARFLPNSVVDTVFIGGGTPSYPGGAFLERLMKLLNKAFTLSRGCEISCECNPESVTPKLAKSLKRAGINRVSLGVQTLNDDMLRRLGRAHDAEQARNAFGLLRGAGFSNINVDLMYGLPEQDETSWEDDLLQVLAWRPEHISCYGLKLEPGTALFGCDGAPDDDTQASMYMTAVNTISHHGYEQYEISNFARKSRECRHNVKYWTLEPYLGFGPGAHSDFGGRRYSYVKDITAYIDGVIHGGAVIDETEAVPLGERAGEYVMLRLRTREGISGNEYTRLFGANFTALEQKLERYAGLGLSVRAGDRWRLTPEGFLLSNKILCDLLEQNS